LSINTYLRCIQAFLDWCHEGGHIREHVKVGRLKEQQKILNTFTGEHLRRLVTCKPWTWGDHRTLTLVLLLLDTGLRIEEALTLRREDVDLDNLLIRVLGKGGNGLAPSFETTS
jgi:integrase/recombinase XerD